MLKVKCNRTEFDLDEHDEVMYNGACYIITTRNVRDGWNSFSPTLAKKTAQSLIASGKLVLDRKEQRMVPVEIYKVNVK